MTDNATLAGENVPLANEDIELLWQAIARAEALLEDLIADQPASADIAALLGYLYEVVLARASEEERQLLPVLRDGGPATGADAGRLERDHLLLRDDVDDLAEAAALYGKSAPDQLAAIVRRLIVRLDEHLRAEAAAWAKLPGSYQPGTARWVEFAHWYPLTEGPLIDLDQLPPDQVDSAVLNRLTHLRPGELVELHSGISHPRRLLARLRRRAPHDYSWSERHDDRDGWLVAIKRRTAD